MGDSEGAAPPAAAIAGDSPICRSSEIRRSLSSRSLSQILAGIKGVVGTPEFRVHSTDDADGQPLSLWHDVPLFAMDVAGRLTGDLHFVCEIPKFTRKKFEIATDEPANPIKQDTKKGQLREFKKGEIGFNYGCFPRTWEDPSYIHPDAGVGGDNDPLDACEIGLRMVPCGEVVPVKLLGCLCMIDDGEADWKMVCIASNDPWAAQLNDVEDVERLLPGTVDAIREWFRTYKIPDGKPPNVFGLDERCMPADYAMDIVRETHLAWRKLVNEQEPGADLHVPDMESLDISVDDHALTHSRRGEVPLGEDETCALM